MNIKWPALNQCGEVPIICSNIPATIRQYSSLDMETTASKTDSRVLTKSVLFLPNLSFSSDVSNRHSAERLMVTNIA